MSEYHNALFTEHPFRVKDLEAFTQEFGSYATGWSLVPQEDGTMWVGGVEVDLMSWDDAATASKEDNEVDLCRMIQHHLAEGEYAGSLDPRVV